MYQFVKIGYNQSEVVELLGGNPQGAPRSPNHFAEYVKYKVP